MYEFVLWDFTPIRLGVVEDMIDWKFSPKHRGMAVWSFTIDLDNPLADEILSRDGDVFCGVKKDSVLQCCGEMTLAEEIGPGYRIVLDRDGLLNRAYSLPAVDYQARDDFASIAAHGLFEGVVPQEFTNPTLRAAMLDATVEIRANPRRELTLDSTIGGDGKATLACNFADPF